MSDSEYWRAIILAHDRKVGLDEAIKMANKHDVITNEMVKSFLEQILPPKCVTVDDVDNLMRTLQGQ